MDGASLKQLPPLCNSHIRIDAEGNWWHNGTVFARPELVRLFSTILREEHGDYLLVTPVERCTVEVADLPFIAVDVERANGIITAMLNIGEKVEIGPEHTLGFDDKGPWVALWRGLRARLSRPAYYRLAEWAEETHDGGKGAWYVTSHGMSFRLDE